MPAQRKYEDMIDHRSYTHDLSSCEIKAWKKIQAWMGFGISYIHLYIKNFEDPKQNFSDCFCCSLLGEFPSVAHHIICVEFP